MSDLRASCTIPERGRNNALGLSAWKRPLAWIYLVTNARCPLKILAGQLQLPWAPPSRSPRGVGRLLRFSHFLFADQSIFCLAAEFIWSAFRQVVALAFLVAVVQGRWVRTNRGSWMKTCCHICSDVDVCALIDRMFFHFMFFLSANHFKCAEIMIHEIGFPQIWHLICRCHYLNANTNTTFHCFWNRKKCGAFECCARKYLWKIYSCHRYLVWLSFFAERTVCFCALAKNKI